MTRDSIRRLVLMLLCCAAVTGPALAGEPERRLFEAAEKGDLAAVRMLLGQKVSVNARDQDLRTPLHEAAYAGQPEVGILLIQHGADIAARDKNGSTPLHEAAKSERLEGVSLPPGSLQALAKLLLDRGAEVNAKDNAEWMPLHWALFKRNAGIARLLIERGADVNAREAINHYTPLDHAVSGGGSLEIVELLISRGANVNAADPAQNTPLHRAASKGWVAGVKLLLAKGADPNARNNSQWAPLDDALHGRHTEAAGLLAFAQGTAAARRQDWLPALRAFEQAYKLGKTPPAPPLLFNLGFTESRLPGREVRAMAWFRLYLRDAPDAANAGAVRQEFAGLRARVRATLDALAVKMKELAAQFPAEQQRQRACGFLAVTQARAGHFREARATAESGECAGKANPNVIVSVLKQIADCQSRAGDFEGAFQTVRDVKNFVDRWEALGTLIEEEARAGECALAKASVNRALQAGVLPTTPKYPAEERAVEIAHQKAAQCPQAVPHDYWDRIRPVPGGSPYDVQAVIAAVAARQNPDQILQGFSEISDTIYFGLVDVSRGLR
jgi:ankyrin repeat protein